MNYWLSRLCIIALMTGTVATTLLWVYTPEFFNYGLLLALMMWALFAKFTLYAFLHEELEN